MAKSKKNDGIENASLPKEAPLAETLNGTGKEAVLAKESIVNITTGFDKLAVKKKEVEALVKKAETIVSTFNKEDKESIEALSNVIRELRTTRTGIESAKTAGSAPFRDLVAKWNADNNSIIEMIKEIEKKAKPIKEELDAEDQKRKDEKKLADQKLLMDRIGNLKDLGFKQEDGFYVLKDDNGEPVVELQAIEISSMSEVNWDKVKKLATDHNAEKERQDELARLEKEKEQKRIEEEKEANRKEAEALANQKLEIRKERLEVMGFVIAETHVTHPIGISFKVSDIKEMENARWNDFVVETKQRIEDAQAKAKRESLFNHIRMNGFTISGNTALFTDGAFSHSVGLDNINEVSDFDSEYTNFKKLHNQYTEAKAATDKKNNERLDKLAAEGLVFINHLNCYILKSTNPGGSDFQITKSHAIEKTEDEFNKLIDSIKTFKNNDIEAKKLYDNIEASRKAKEQADQQSDAKNITQFKKDIDAAFAKFTLKNPNAQTILSKKVNDFKDSL
jgi:hypothetical protein